MSTCDDALPSSLQSWVNRSVDEPRDNWRPLFHERFSRLVQNANGLSEAALALNRDIWSIWNITFLANQTPDIMSPFQVQTMPLPFYIVLCTCDHVLQKEGHCRLSAFSMRFPMSQDGTRHQWTLGHLQKGLRSKDH